MLIKTIPCSVGYWMITIYRPGAAVPNMLHQWLSGSDGSCSGLKSHLSRFDPVGSHQYPAQANLVKARA